MNYNLIKDIATIKKVTIKKLLSTIDISEPGFYKMIDNRSMKVETLEKIANVLQVPVSVFFEKNPTITHLDKKINLIPQINNQPEFNYLLLEKENQHLKEKLELKDEIITELRRVIKNYE